MIEITLSQLIDSVSVMQELAKKPMKTKVAFQVARLLREVEKEYTLFQEARKNLIEKYAERNTYGELKVDSDGNYNVPKEKIELFNEELKEVIEQNITLNAEQININDLEEANFTPSEMILLLPFIYE